MLNHDHAAATLDEDVGMSDAKTTEETDDDGNVLHAVHVFGITPQGKLLLSRHPDIAETELLADGLWSTSAATLVRDDEDRDDAALRILEDDLDHADGNPIHLGDTVDRIDDDVFRMHSAYYVHVPYEHLHPREDGREYKAMNLSEFQELLNTPESLSPWLHTLWEHHAHALPLQTA
jgi:hypothetical protein